MGPSTEVQIFIRAFMDKANHKKLIPAHPSKGDNVGGTLSKNMGLALQALDEDDINKALHHFSKVIVIYLIIGGRVS